MMAYLGEGTSVGKLVELKGLWSKFCYFDFAKCIFMR